MNQKVKNPLPAPKVCDVCGSDRVVCDDNKILYGKNYGKWPKCYYCMRCQSFVGCHPGTLIPLGKMATQATRRQRRRVHELIDPLWQSGLAERSNIYQWMAIVLHIPIDDAHISWFDKTQLDTIEELLPAYIQSVKDSTEELKSIQDRKASIEREHAANKRYRKLRQSRIKQASKQKNSRRY